MSKRDLTITLAGLCTIAALATCLFCWLGTIKPEMATLRWVDIPAINIMGALYAGHIIHIYKHPEGAPAFHACNDETEMLAKGMTKNQAGAWDIDESLITHQNNWAYLKQESERKV